MLSNAISKKVTCSYRTITQPPHMAHTWVGVVLEPLQSEKNYCQDCNHTPIQYPFGKMLDSDASLTIIEEANNG